MLKYSINISGIEIEVERKRVKNLRLTVHPPFGEVRVAVPVYYSYKIVHAFVAGKIDWIEKHRKKYLSGEYAMPIRHKYLSGEEIYFKGEKFTLVVDETAGRARVETAGRELILRIKKDSTIAKRRSALEEWYRKRLKEDAGLLIGRWEREMGVQSSGFGIKKMKTRWGSCNIRSKKIWLNLALAKAPQRSLEFIIVHELVHLLEKNHNANFKRLMDRFYPEWKACAKELNGIKLA